MKLKRTHIPHCPPYFYNHNNTQEQSSYRNCKQNAWTQKLTNHSTLCKVARQESQRRYDDFERKFKESLISETFKAKS